MARPDAMRCPVCRLPLRRVAAREAELHRCGRCRGIWLAAQAATRLAAHRRRERPASVRPRQTTGLARPRDGYERVCPHCPDLFLRPCRIDLLPLDRCPDCGGIWFDAGELACYLQKASRSRSREAVKRDDAMRGEEPTLDDVSWRAMTRHRMRRSRSIARRMKMDRAERAAAGESAFLTEGLDAAARFLRRLLFRR